MMNIVAERRPSTELDAESIFEDSLGVFGAQQVALGEPGGQVVYTIPAASPSVTKLRLKLPEAEHCELFAHYLWNGAVWLADQVASGNFDVRMKRIVELGAGSGLPSLVCAVMEARNVVITDYPEPQIISTLLHNVQVNLPLELQNKCAVIGHKWGEDTSHVLRAISCPRVPKGCLCNVKESKPSQSDEIRARKRHESETGGQEGNENCDVPRDIAESKTAVAFDIILLADTTWLVEQHFALLQSCMKLLAPQGEIWAVCSDHKGIGEHRKFLELATSATFGFYLLHEQTIKLQSGWSSSRSNVSADESGNQRAGILYFYKLTKNSNSDPSKCL